MNDQTKYELGKTLGAEAFKAGKTAAPALDKRVMAIIASTSTKIGDSLSLLKGWNEGWHSANTSQLNEIADRIASELYDEVCDRVCDLMNGEEALAKLEDTEDCDQLIEVHDNIMDRLATKLRDGDN